MKGRKKEFCLAKCTRSSCAAVLSLIISWIACFGIAMLTAALTERSATLWSCRASFSWELLLSVWRSSRSAFLAASPRLVELSWPPASSRLRLSSPLLVSSLRRSAKLSPALKWRILNGIQLAMVQLLTALRRLRFSDNFGLGRRRLSWRSFLHHLRFQDFLRNLNFCWLRYALSSPSVGWRCWSFAGRWLRFRSLGWNWRLFWFWWCLEGEEKFEFKMGNEDSKRCSE